MMFDLAVEVSIAFLITSISLAISMLALTGSWFLTIQMLRALAEMGERPFSVRKEIK